MNEQTSGQLRQLLQIVGTLLTTLGYLQPGMADTWIPVVMQIAGPISMIAGMVWSWWVNRPVNIVASVAAMGKDPASPVKGVITTNTKEGVAMAAAIDGPVVSAGSVAATNMAQARN